MYFTSGSDRAFEQLMQTRPGADHFDSGEAGAPEDCGTCRFYRPHWKYQFCVYEECPYQPGKLTALDGAVKFQVKGVGDEMAVFRVEKNRGYTVMSNHHLRNKDLSLKAKGLLSQMLSLPESWDFTLKGLSLINREQIDAIRAAVRELEQAGYIVRSRERDSQGRLRGADYIIYEQPQPVPDSPTLENPTLDNPTQEKPTQEKPTQEKTTQLNKDRSSKEKSITDGSNTDSIPILSPPSPLGEEAAAPPERKGTGAKSQSAVEIYREIIKDNIEYEHLCQYAKGIDRDMLEGEKKLLSLVCCKLLCAVAAPHVYEAVTATFTCAGNTFTAKGKTILTPGWKELDRRFKASFKTDADDTAPEPARELPEISEGQTFDKVTAAVTEHFTAPPKSYTEDTLLSAMERAGADDLPEDAERQGLGTPATRASILEKLVQMGFVERRGKQLLPTKDGHNLACVLPEVLTSPQLTAQWETELTAIAKGQADPEGFMAGIAEMTRGLIANYSQISEDAQKLFQTERVVIGKCPRCGESVYEGKKNYYCGNRSCQFVMWKNDRFFEERGKAFTPKIAAALLKDRKAKVKGLRSMKTGKTYDGTVLLADTGGKYVNYRVEQRGKN